MINRVNWWDRSLQYRYNPTRDRRSRAVPKVRFSYTLSLPRHNIQLLYKIKSILGPGNIIKDKFKCKYIISNNKHLINTILPLFDKYPLLTYKYNRYRVFRESIMYKDETRSIGDRVSSIRVLCKASSANAEEASRSDIM